MFYNADATSFSQDSRVYSNIDERMVDGSSEDDEVNLPEQHEIEEE